MSSVYLCACTGGARLYSSEGAQYINIFKRTRSWTKTLRTCAPPAPPARSEAMRPPRNSGVQGVLRVSRRLALFYWTCTHLP